MKKNDGKKQFNRKIGSLLVNFSDPFEYENVRQFIRVCFERDDRKSIEESMRLLEFERDRLKMLQRYEMRLKKKGIALIAGVDEAGRGPLAGPLVAASVVFDSIPYLPFVNDSKLLGEKDRELVCEWINRNAHDVGIGIVTSVEIDRLNIHNASLLAMRRAVRGLRVPPDYVLVDGLFPIPDLCIPQESIVKGDRVSFTVACASIIAKVTRDKMMCEYDRIYPQFGFAKNKGYPTKRHIEMLEQCGQSIIHRRSYAPVKKYMSKRNVAVKEMLNI